MHFNTADAWEFLYLDNIVSENQWGGIDIRHGGDPVIAQNIICNGMSDGVVIGERGRGSIENNVISGNYADFIIILHLMHDFTKTCLDN